MDGLYIAVVAVFYTTKSPQEVYQSPLLWLSNGIPCTQSMMSFAHWGAGRGGVGGGGGGGG